MEPSLTRLILVWNQTLALFPKAGGLGFLGKAFAVNQLKWPLSKACFVRLCLAGISIALTGCAGQAPNMTGFVAQGSYTSLALGNQSMKLTESADAGGNYRVDSPDVVCKIRLKAAGRFG